jgi:hypothetical protein
MISSVAIKTTMAKILAAQASMRPLKVRSAIAELPRESRKRRTSETGEAEGTGIDDAAIPFVPEGSEEAPEKGCERVSGFRTRISDNGTVTCMRLTAQYE